MESGLRIIDQWGGGGGGGDPHLSMDKLMQHAYGL